MNCISCGKPAQTNFKCPKCGAQVTRCSVCRKNGVKYKCVKCGEFEGP